MRDDRFDADITASRMGCTGCGRVFGGVTGFDAHRVGRDDERRVCVDPATKGYVRTEVGVWRVPDTRDKDEYGSPA